MCNANVLNSSKYYSNEYMTPGLRSTLVRIVKKANPSSKEGD